MINKIINSSHNPEKISLAVKGVLMNIVGIIVITGGSSIDVGSFTSLVENISVFIGTAVLLVGQAQVAYGLVRKLWSPKI